MRTPTDFALVAVRALSLGNCVVERLALTRTREEATLIAAQVVQSLQKIPLKADWTGRGTGATRPQRLRTAFQDVCADVEELDDGLKSTHDWLLFWRAIETFYGVRLL